MRYAVVLIINIILVLAGFFLLFGDPLNKQLPTKMIAYLVHCFSDIRLSSPS